MAQRNYDRRYSSTPCKWSIESTEVSPHTCEVHKPTPKICDSILDAIGNTPIVRINNISKQEGITCELLVKCEYLNPGGSVKDRVGTRIVTDLEKSGRLRPGMTLVEPTSGNTGIGLAMSSIIKGYELIICMPEKMSQEKNDILVAMGAKIIRTPTEAGFSDADSYVGVAEKIERDNPDTHVMAGQYFNPSNPLAHYDHTAEEIFDQCEGHLDYIVIGSGTGGQITGLSRKLKEKMPNLVIVGVDPLGSIIHDPENTIGGSYKAEGMGSGIVPRSCNTELIDQWYVVDDHNTFEYARKLIKHEGLLVGGSSGTVMYAAVQLAKTLTADKRVLVVLPDGIRNYMTKFLNDRWMVQNGFLKEVETEPVVGKTIRDLKIESSEVIAPSLSIRETIQIMKLAKVTEIPVLSDGKILGVASSSVINKRLIEGKNCPSDLVEKVMVKNAKYLNFDTSLAFVAVWMEDWKYAVVHDKDFIGMVYPIHLSEFLTTIS